MLHKEKLYIRAQRLRDTKKDRERETELREKESKLEIAKYIDRARQGAFERN